jgi:DnaK suppressor protein
MTTTLPDARELPARPMELLRGMLEDEFAVQTARLTELTVSARLPRRGGLDPRALEMHTASARRRIASTAYALKRMSEGTYGVCERCAQPIPLGRLRIEPSASCCAPCARSARPASPRMP